jgi:hypothetical protein
MLKIRYNIIFIIFFLTIILLIGYSLEIILIVFSFCISSIFYFLEYVITKKTKYTTLYLNFIINLDRHIMNYLLWPNQQIELL